MRERESRASSRAPRVKVVVVVVQCCALLCASTRTATAAALNGLKTAMMLWKELTLMLSLSQPDESVTVREKEMEERDERGDRGVVLLLLDKIRVTHRSYSCAPAPTGV